MSERIESLISGFEQINLDQSQGEELASRFEHLNSIVLLELAKSVFPDRLYEFDLRAKIVVVLMQLLYRDARSLDALLYIAKMAVKSELLIGNGSNALCAIALVCRDLSIEDRAKVFAAATECRTINGMSNNANQCLSELSAMDSESGLKDDI